MTALRKSFAVTTLGVLLTADCGILVSGCVHEPSPQPGVQESGQLRQSPSLFLPGTASPQKEQDPAAVFLNHTAKDSAVAPLGEAASPQKEQDSAAVFLNHTAKDSAVAPLGAAVSSVSRVNIQQKFSGNCGISPLLQNSLKLCLHRSILEIYYMDYQQMAAGLYGRSLTNWKKLDLLPVRLLPDSIRQEGFLLHGTGTLDMHSIPVSVRRTDFDCNMQIHKEGCTAIHSAGSGYAKLFRQAELKGYHLLLRHFSSRLDLHSRIGKQAAFELLIAATVQNCDFVSDLQHSRLHLTAEITVAPDRLSPASRTACRLTAPLTFRLQESIIEDPDRK